MGWGRPRPQFQSYFSLWPNHVLRRRKWPLSPTLPFGGAREQIVATTKSDVNSQTWRSALRLKRGARETLVRPQARPGSLGF
jgi:hypothetical protein